MTEPLWPIPLPVIGGTGEHGAGKTLFGMTIAPPEVTGVFDLEMSSASYESLGVHRWDVPRIMSDASKGRPYRPVDVWKWWRREVEAIKPGRFRVLMLDPASEIEAGLSQWVWDNPAEFGKTKAQYQKSNALYQSDVKDVWKLVMTQIAAKVETFYFTVHLRQKFEGNAPTNKREPKGKVTLSELASLFLWFERKPDARGAVPDVPSATVRKHRLIHTSRAGGKLRIVPAVPPRLPVATPDAVRAYMIAPPDPAAYTLDECAPAEAGMSEDDRLEMRARIAQDEKDRAQAELGLVEVGARVAELELAAAGGKAAVAVPKATPAPAPPATVVVKAARDMSAAALESGAAEEEVIADGVTLAEALATEVPLATPAPDDSPELSPGDGVMDGYTGTITDGQLIAISGLRKEWERLDPPTDRDRQWKVFLSKWNVETARGLNAAQGQRCTENLKQIVAQLKGGNLSDFPAGRSA